MTGTLGKLYALGDMHTPGQHEDLGLLQTR